MESYRYRVLTSWVNDISAAPHWGGRWPMIELSDETVGDTLKLIDTAARWGYNALVSWGLFVAHAWPTDLARCAPKEHMRKLRVLFDAAASKGVKLLVGLGVYSWGFEEITKACPVVRQGESIKCWGKIVPHNGDCMCFSQLDSREWMRRIVDFIVETTNAPGFQLQPFDRGRCICPQCASMDDSTYFSALICDIAGYIKEKWPDKLVAVSGWGMSFDRQTNMDAVKRMASHVDYLSDITNSSLKTGREFRRQLIAQLPCAFGDSAGCSVTCPQTWDRLRWYLPHVRLNGAFIRTMFEDGGRASEIFAGPLMNPGTAVSLRALGALLLDPTLSDEAATEAAVDELYRPLNSETRTRLTQIVLHAEQAYFDGPGARHEGDLLFEELTNVCPGPPIYLLGRSGDVLKNYARAMDDLADQAANYENAIAEKRILLNTVTALRNAAGEARKVEAIAAGI